MIKAVLFDLGDTLISEVSVGTKHTGEVELEKVPFVDEVLKSVSRRYKLAVITNTTISKEKDIRKGLRKVRIEKYFDAIVTSVDVGQEKPDNKIFLTALRKLRVKPTEAVMVGNRIKTDILGANRLGIITVYFKWNDRYPEEVTSPIEKPNYTINSLKELLDILAGLEEGEKVRSELIH